MSVPFSSEVIPEGTGLVQSLECKGAIPSGKKEQPLSLPVAAQITTFSNGVRRVCCPYANVAHFLRLKRAVCKAGDKQTFCIYSWEDPKLGSQ